MGTTGKAVTVGGGIVAGWRRPEVTARPGVPTMTQQTTGPVGVDAGRTTRLLIVDDHSMFADSLGMALSTESDLTVVGTAATLAQARAMIVSEAPDVVLLDHRLPDGLGVDSIHELKALRPSAKIVVLTA